MYPTASVAEFEPPWRADTMVEQSKVTSGFDIDFLITEEFIRYFLLCSLDTG